MMPGIAKTKARRPDHVPHTLETIFDKCIDDGGCWIWQGGLGHGTPMLSHERQPIPVRRYIAEHIQGRQVGKLLATARCMNRLCVAPDCIELVTRARLQKRWADHLMYSQNPVRNAKIAAVKRSQSPHSEEVVQKVRELSERMSQREVARTLGLNFDFVNKIVTGKSRRDYSNNPWAGLLAA